ncbi:MAG: DNA polymerase, partial [Planctomycetota bacterium]
MNRVNIINDFGRLAGDHATYAFGDSDGAVRVARSATSVACDIETGAAGSERRWLVKAVSISDGVKAHVLDPRLQGHATAIRDCLAGATRLVFHNSSYDVPILSAAGLMRLDDIGKVTDTLVAARLAWPDFTTHSNRLGDVATRVLGGDYDRWKGSLEAGWKAVTGKSKSAMFDELGVGSDAYVAYAAFDTIVTARVDEKLMDALAVALNPGLPSFRVADARYLNDREQAVNRLLLRRSATGIGFDDEAADAIVDELRAKASLHRQALTEAGVDPDAPASAIARETVTLLDQRGKLPNSWPRLKNGTPTTNKAWMAKLNHPLVDHAAALVQAERFSSGYSASTAFLARDGVIRPQVNVLAAVTGRMSYGQPALQQFPGEVRRMFAFDRPVTSFDWSSIEPVVAANLANDAGILGFFEGGGDIYQPIAEAVGI